jgi:23S rRNA (uracil1939-C5)-methyltransferase
MEVTIERILPGGFGLGHAEGKTVMVALAAPGDRLRVRVDREKGAVCFASIVEIIEASSHRIEPPCPYFGRCGGCDFQQLSYQAQLDAKAEIIKDCLHRIGRIEDVPAFQITPAPHEWHYRSRAQWQYDAEQKQLGYYESGSRRVCDVAECAVLVPELQTELENLRQQMADDLLPPDARYFRAVVGDDGVAVSPGVRSPTSGSPAGQPGGGGAVRGGNVSQIRRTINGQSYTLNAESFFQTNEHLLPELINAAIGDASGDTALELYSGVGLFTLPLARRFKGVIAVEENRDAARFARQNLATASLTNAQIETKDVATWLALECGGRAQRRRRFGSDRRTGRQVGDEEQIQSAVEAGALQIDFLLLDPPRTGAESRVIDGILQIRPKRICYVSCDPATLARDLRKIIAGGYALDSIAAFDMFPQTHHVETVVNLSGP